MNQNYLEALKNRRSYYGIGRDTDVTPEQIQEIVEQALLHTPSAFNSQTTRVVVLFGGHHEKLWSITAETLHSIVPESAFPKTEEKLQSFGAGVGTILFFEDMSVVEQLQTSFPTYAQNFPIWSQQTSGMHQHVIWTALELEGLGASIQHYNPLIDNAVKASWDIPDSWELIAQMPFGAPTAVPGEKKFAPIEGRMRIIF